MKRSITLSIALALSIVLLSLTSSDRTAQAQQQAAYSIDTGMVTLGPNQVLRVVAGFDPGPLDGKFIRFKQIEYAQNTCNNGVCKHTIASQNTLPPITLAPGEAASIDITPLPNTSGVRVVVLSNYRDVKVNAMITDNATGQTTSLLLQYQEASN